jgi:hypothetical protein
MAVDQEMLNPSQRRMASKIPPFLASLTRTPYQIAMPLARFPSATASFPSTSRRIHLINTARRECRAIIAESSFSKALEGDGRSSASPVEPDPQIM